jgi:hypothetical protein
MSEPGSGQETPREGGKDNTDNHSIKTGSSKKKYMNGWTNELEEMMADWADKAACYRWMHEETSRLYQGRDRYFNIPVIILSGLTAGANFAMNSLIGDDPVKQRYAQLGLGGASLITGIIQTLMNFYAYAKLNEAHRVAGISWGKFNRLLCIEMRLHPDERMDNMNFLKMFRIELDRLIEQSPIIPNNVINHFNKLFKKVDIVKPEITGLLQHTKVFKDSSSRLRRIAAEATINLHYRRGVIKQLVADEIEKRTRSTAIEAAREVAKEVVADQNRKAAEVIAQAKEAKERAEQVIRSAMVVKRSTAPLKSSGQVLVERQKAERQRELGILTKQKAGMVSALKNRFNPPEEVSLDSTIAIEIPERPRRPSVPASVASAVSKTASVSSVASKTASVSSVISNVSKKSSSSDTSMKTANSNSSPQSTNLDTVITISEPLLEQVEAEEVTLNVPEEVSKSEDNISKQDD